MTTGILLFVKQAIKLKVPTHMILGENFFPLLLLALGAALVVGPTLALIRPPKNKKDNDLEKAPLLRSLSQIIFGSIISLWAIATLLQ